MSFRGIRRVAVIVPALLALAASCLPAQAQDAGLGVGVVSGTVSLNPGFAPTCLPLCPQTFTFGSTLIVGAIASTAGSGTFADSASASGGSLAGLENAAGGVGTLSASATPATCQVTVNAPPPVGPTTVACPPPTVSVTLSACVGIYVRIGSLVVVELGVTVGSGPCTITVNGKVTTGVVLVPASLFVPQQTPPATLSSALFDGLFVAAGAAA